MLTKPQPNSKLSLHKDVLSRDLDGEELILSLDEGMYFGLDGVGQFIWNLLQKETTPSLILNTVLEEFDVSKEQAERDLYDLLQQLIDKRLISVA